MALKIRLARGGSKKRPFYRIVVAEASAPRDGRFLERVGSYNPLLSHEHADRIVLNSERIQHWISKGAQPTDRVVLFLSKAGIIPAPARREDPKKSAPKAKAQERIKKEAEEKLAAEAAKAASIEAAKAAKAAAAEAAAAPAEAVAEAAVETAAE